MSLDTFHPSVRRWFEKRLGQPTEPQSKAWPEIQARRHTLIAAPTGSGKTLAAFLAAIDDLVRKGLDGRLAEATYVVYVSPLKALSNDIRRNLEEPLAGIRTELKALGLPDVEIRTMVRTGDTTASERSAMTRRPPHILVTTPESLYILLTSDGGRRMLQSAETVIVDEIHAVADDKRGSHLSLSVERLAALVEGRNGSTLVRIGLSATQRPIEEVARFLVGTAHVSKDGTPDCVIIDSGHRRRLDLAIEIPESPIEPVMSGEVWEEIYNRLAALIASHKTTLVFVNTRRLAERVTRFISERVGEENVATHHGSLSKEQRFDAEQRLKTGRLKALVATASLELGIDIGDVDLVCQLGTPRSIAAFLQRVGRSGHFLAGTPKGRIFPLSRDELVECAAILDAVRRGELDRLVIPEKPFDILAQQIVAAVSAEEWREDDLFESFHDAWPYRNLSRYEFDATIGMLADGFTTRRGRRGALIHHDAIGKRLRARRGSRLTAVTSGGAIPDNADYRVILEPAETFIGTLNEDFAIESSAGDIFQLGNASWRILRVERGQVRVADAKGSPPTVPFWLGEAPGRTAELSFAVSRLREEVGQRLEAGEVNSGPAVRWLIDEVGISEAAAVQIAAYLASAKAALGVVPSQNTLVIERFFDEAGNMHVVVHSPFGSRLNRAWGLALRKRFCRQFNFELQAAATDDAIVLSLGPTHSFPLADVFRYLNSRTVRDILIQALLDAPMFGIRWRWNAGRALAIPRFRGGKRVPPQLQRMEAEDLIAVVFPDQLACLENITGDRQVPDHPLVGQTIKDCLEEAMDIDTLEALLSSIENGDKTLVVRDLTEASPMAHEILNARPYAFLDDAPLEERRTQAVQTRRWLTPESASSLGALNPAAIERVREEAWPESRNADELHEALVLMGFLATDEKPAGEEDAFFAQLMSDRRAAVMNANGREFRVAAERLPEILQVYPGATMVPLIEAPATMARREWTPEKALIELLRGRMESIGPVTTSHLAQVFGLSTSTLAAALAALESEGFVFQGSFTPGAAGTEWCERRLLARIHRYTLDKLRREIEPVSAADFVQFLLSWQHLRLDKRFEGPAGLLALLEQLEGFESPAVAWEREIWPARLLEYDPVWLDALCLSGRFVWNRRPEESGNGDTGARSGPVRTTPIRLVSREHLSAWSIGDPSASEDRPLSGSAQAVFEYLRGRGASFFDEIVRGAGLLRTQVEDGLGELVAWGLVSSDSYAGLRSLLVPSNKRPRVHGGRHRGGMATFGIEMSGRWFPVGAARHEAPAEHDVEMVARALLRRYGVVFRALMDREGRLPPWRDLLHVYRRLEARGEIRGGRFVSGFSGEQYALPEAVAELRAQRRAGGDETMISVSAADPLNLTGILLPGDRVPALAGNRVLYRDGVPIAVYEKREVRFLIELEGEERWRAREALLKRRVPARLRAYLGR